jgi:hypothetical protein
VGSGVWLSSADVARRLKLIAKRDKLQFVAKTLRRVRSVAAAGSLCWLAHYLKSYLLGGGNKPYSTNDMLSEVSSVGIVMNLCKINY